jgi:hypothetical protein
MAKITKAKRERAEAEEFRVVVAALQNVRHNDWNDWEHDWLRDELRRAPDYVYTEKEHDVLIRLQSYAKSFTEYAGYTVCELIAIAYSCRFDLDEDGQEFVEQLHAWGATDLKRRQIKRLAGICRRFESVGYDTLEQAA